MKADKLALALSGTPGLTVMEPPSSFEQLIMFAYKDRKRTYSVHPETWESVNGVARRVEKAYQAWCRTIDRKIDNAD